MSKVKTLLFWCGFGLIAVCFLLTIVQNRLHNEKIYELVGYYPNTLPTYHRSLTYRTSDDAAKDVSPYDPHKETLEEYEWRVYLAYLQRTDISLYEEEMEKDETAQREFYEQQAAELREAERIASKEIDDRFIRWYIAATIIAAGVAMIGVRCLKIKKRRGNHGVDVKDS